MVACVCVLECCSRREKRTHILVAVKAGGMLDATARHNLCRRGLKHQREVGRLAEVITTQEFNVDGRADYTFVIAVACGPRRKLQEARAQH